MEPRLVIMTLLKISEILTTLRSCLTRDQEWILPLLLWTNNMKCYRECLRVEIFVYKGLFGEVSWLYCLYFMLDKEERLIKYEDVSFIKVEIKTRISFLTASCMSKSIRTGTIATNTNQYLKVYVWKSKYQFECKYPIMTPPPHISVVACSFTVCCGVSRRGRV